MMRIQLIFSIAITDISLGNRLDYITIRLVHLEGFEPTSTTPLQITVSKTELVTSAYLHLIGFEDQWDYKCILFCNKFILYLLQNKASRHSLRHHVVIDVPTKRFELSCGQLSFLRLMRAREYIGLFF